MTRPRETERALQPLMPEQRRTRRAVAALEAGQHPLSVPLRIALPLHPDAAPHTDPAAAGVRCGGCRFRQRVKSGRRWFYKCVAGDGTRVQAEYVEHAGITDVRAWWPGCGDWAAPDVGEEKGGAS